MTMNSSFKLSLWKHSVETGLSVSSSDIGQFGNCWSRQNCLVQSMQGLSGLFGAVRAMIEDTFPHVHLQYDKAASTA